MHQTNRIKILTKFTGLILFIYLLVLLALVWTSFAEYRIELTAITMLLAVLAVWERAVNAKQSKAPDQKSVKAEKHDRLSPQSGRGIVSLSDHRLRINELKSINSILAKNLRSKDRLLKLVSHDLKAPLRNVIGLTDSIMRKYSDEINDDLINRLNRIKKSIEKEFHLISDILGDVRSGALQSGSVDLDSIIQSITAQLTYEIQSKNIEIKIIKPLPVIKTNGDIMKHIFQNLIDNACKSFTQTQGNLIQIDHKLEQYEYKFMIRDNGPGIPDNLRDSIFEFEKPLLFNTGDEPHGLGLPLVNTFVNMINGKIGFESTIGSGTTFYLSLPRVLID